MDEGDATRDSETSSVDPGKAAEVLFAELYMQLRRLAALQMGRQSPGHTLQTTALVNEAYLKLGERADWNSKAHFMAAAARAMRSILVDHARTKGRRKRRAEGVRVPLDAVLEAYEGEAFKIDALDAALERLAGRGEKGRQAARVVELRFFCGLPIDEIAELMDIARRSVDRAWALAKATLKSEL